MIRYEEDCVECGKPCMTSCPLYRPHRHYYCDVCGNEFDREDLTNVDGVHVCGDCLIGYLEKKGIIGRIDDDD
ncbi:MAG: hypothetical protein SOI44_00460 [Lactimicrobium sp.]|jgi:hypothetical protein|uniref:hypothetical protein n=1 Tax=Lactimicrobium sp. TaxID=2563780 RepID=UPI002F355302